MTTFSRLMFQLGWEREAEDRISFLHYWQLFITALGTTLLVRTRDSISGELGDKQTWGQAGPSGLGGSRLSLLLSAINSVCLPAPQYLHLHHVRENLTILGSSYKTRGSGKWRS